MIIGMLVACGAPSRGPSTTAPRPHATPVVAVATAPPAPVARERRIVVGDLQQRVLHEAQQRRLEAAAIDIAESDLWSPCLRDFVRAQDEIARRTLTLAFARLEVDCDQDGRIVLGPPHGYRARSHLGYRASFAPGDIRAGLTVAICESGIPSGDRIVLEYDGHRLPLPRLDFARDRDGCYVAELPPSLTLARTLPDLFIAADVAVRFEAALDLDDLVVSPEMLRDMRLVFDAVDAVATR